MHASIWTFHGDPNQLVRSYDAMVADVPSANMRLHLCLRASYGLVLVDTCPTKEAFEAFFASEGARMLREKHGLPEPERVDDFPVHASYVGGERTA